MKNLWKYMLFENFLAKKKLFNITFDDLREWIGPY